LVEVKVDRVTSPRRSTVCITANVTRVLDRGADLRTRVVTAASADHPDRCLRAATASFADVE